MSGVTLTILERYLIDFSFIHFITYDTCYPPPENAPNPIAVFRPRRKSRAKPHAGWIKFEAEFTKLRPEFASHLLDAFPELTTQEFRICAMLTKSMPSIAIAEQLSISEWTVNNHRANIRRKFALKGGKSNDLAKFLMRF